MCWSARSSTAACVSSPSSRKRELSPTWPRRATPTAAAKTAVHQDRHSATHGAPLPLGRLCSATPQREMTSATTPSSLMYRPPRRLPDRMWIRGSTSVRESAGRTATARQNQSILHFHDQGQSCPCKTPHAAAYRLLQEDPRDCPDEPTRSLLRPARGLRLSRSSIVASMSSFNTIRDGDDYVLNGRKYWPCNVGGWDGKGANT